jgi:phage replication-related protein YjqB (UPF0714/DUF867 family)
MSDLYASFSELQAAEVYGEDYHIQYGVRPSNILMIAPHAGGIEVGTSELTMEVAGDEHSYYLFEGYKSSGNSSLHITSTNFDEPNAIRIIESSEYLISFHGYGDSSNKMTKIGGLNRELRAKVHKALMDRGFNVEILDDSDPISGTDPDNLSNRTRSGMGVQLELSTAQRDAFFGTNTRAERRNTKTDELREYARAIRSVLPN